MNSKFYSASNGSLQALGGVSAQTGLDVGQGFKYSVARNGSTFYVFVNDKLVSKYNYSALADKMTVPGILTVAQSGSNFTAAGGMKISGIDYYGGVKAKAKIEVLTGEELNSDIEIDVGGTNWGEYDKPLD